MIRFDHLRIPVTDLARSRSWNVDTLRLRGEFEVPDRGAVSSSRTVRASHGAELEDPDGYLVRLWDERSMKES